MGADLVLLVDLPPETTPPRQCRWRHARVAVPAVVMLAVAATFGAARLLAGHRGHSNAAAQPVSWVSNPPGPLAAVRTSDAGADAYPICNPDDWSAVLTRAGVERVGDWSRYQFTATYRGTVICRIPNQPMAAEVLAQDQSVLAPGGYALLNAFSGNTAVEPGDTVVIPVGVCGTSARFVKLNYRAGGADHWTAPTPLPDTAAGCTTGHPAGVSTWRTFVAPAGSTLPLVSRLTAPAEATAGSTIHYQVTITNPTDNAIALDPCPSYRQTLTKRLADKPTIIEEHQLNCSITTVEPGASTQFAMQIDAPQHAGIYQLAWRWLGIPYPFPSGYVGYPWITVRGQRGRTRISPCCCTSTTGSHWG